MKASHQAWQQALRSASVSRSPALLGPASESGNVVVGRGSQCPTHGVKSPTRRSKGLLTRPSATCCKMNSNCVAAVHDCLEQFSSILPLRELHSHGDAPGPASAASAVPCPACCSLFCTPPPTRPAPCASSSPLSPAPCAFCPSPSLALGALAVALRPRAPATCSPYRYQAHPLTPKSAPAWLSAAGSMFDGQPQRQRQSSRVVMRLCMTARASALWSCATM